MSSVGLDYISFSSKYLIKWYHTIQNNRGGLSGLISTENTNICQLLSDRDGVSPCEHFVKCKRNIWGSCALSSQSRNQTASDRWIKEGESRSGINWHEWKVCKSHRLLSLRWLLSVCDEEILKDIPPLSVAERLSWRNSVLQTLTVNTDRNSLSESFKGMSGVNTDTWHCRLTQ